MRCKPRSPRGVLPPPLIVRSGNPLGKDAIRIVVRRWRKLMLMQYHFCFRKRRDEASHRGAIAAERRVGAAVKIMNVESVGVDESLFQKLPRDVETDKTQIGRRRKRRVCQFVDVKGKFSSNMRVRIFVVGYDASKLAPQFRKFDRGRWID